MLGNWAAILILEKDFDDDSGEKYVFNHEISPFLDLMKKSENKLVRKNGVRALAIFSSKLAAWSTMDKQLLVKMTEFLRDVILFDSDGDNILNSLNVLAKNVWANYEVFFTITKEFFGQLISLLRFFNHLKITLNFLKGGKFQYN